MSKWLNNKKRIFNADEIEKPCKLCMFCPYGAIVEEFKLEESEYSCKTFGHDCPVYYNAEFIMEDDKIN